MNHIDYNMSPESHRQASREFRRDAGRLGRAAVAFFLLGVGLGMATTAWAFIAFAGAAGLWACAMASMGKAVDFARHAALLEKTEAHECRDVR